MGEVFMEVKLQRRSDKEGCCGPGWAGLVGSVRTG